MLKLKKFTNVLGSTDEPTNLPGSNYQTLT